MGPDTPADGEMNTQTTIYQKQIAQTIAKFLELDFKVNADRNIAEAIPSVRKSDAIIVGIAPQTFKAGGGN